MFGCCCQAKEAKENLLKHSGSISKGQALQVENQRFAEQMLSFDKDIPWKDEHVEDGTTLGWFPPEMSPSIMARGQTRINASVEEFVSFVMPKNKETYAKMVSEVYGEIGKATDMVWVSDEISYVWLHLTYGVAWIQDRDIMFGQRHYATADGTHFVIVTPLNKWDRHPVKKELVRAEFELTCGYIIRPVAEHEIDVTFLTSTNLKGWIPLWLSNRISRTNGKVVTQIRKHFEPNKSETLERFERNKVCGS
eukprot:c8201_g1_i2.p1 GENE.c8201_g1_i2~~c8201_g1_i2.p1  ORF type:complete len:251 (-),score=52.81 c8201_g1_i2:2-754(-)